MRSSSDECIYGCVTRCLQLTLESLVGQSPTMLRVTREALLRGRQMTLAECFKMELGIVARAIDDEDFYDECGIPRGVRMSYTTL